MSVRNPMKLPKKTLSERPVHIIWTDRIFVYRLLALLWNGKWEGIETEISAALLAHVPGEDFTYCLMRPWWWSIIFSSGKSFQTSLITDNVYRIISLRVTYPTGALYYKLGSVRVTIFVLLKITGTSWWGWSPYPGLLRAGRWRIKFEKNAHFKTCDSRGTCPCHPHDHSSIDAVEP